jgi:hypothetical protein
VSLGYQFCKDLIGCHEAEYFTRAVVEAFGDDVEIVLGVAAEVCPFGQILADQAVSLSHLAYAMPKH